MWNDAVYISASKIEGNGLFSKRDIKKNEIIVDYRNLQWYTLNVDQLTEYQINRNWLIMLGEGMCETTDTIKELYYMNHSRNPNTNWYIKEKYITAARDIKAGEELTIDYRLEERSNRTKFPDWI
jgi:SET domain-containing protein